MGPTETLETPPAAGDEAKVAEDTRDHADDQPQPQTQPTSELKPRPAQGTSNGRPPVFWATAAAAVLMIIGGFGTWASVTSIFGSLSVAGTSGDGWFLIAGGAIGAGLLFWHVSQPQAWKPALIVAAALLGLVPAVIDFGNIHDVTGGSNGVLVQIGWGLYISVIASAALLVAGIYTLVKRPYADAPRAQAA